VALGLPESKEGSADVNSWQLPSRGRLEVADRPRHPQVPSLGPLDVIVVSSTGLPDPLAGRFAVRPVYLKTMSGGDARDAGRVPELAALIARKPNAATGPTVLFVPLGAFRCSTSRTR
jgi:hypothetical protein